MCMCSSRRELRKIFRVHTNIIFRKLFYIISNSLKINVSESGNSDKTCGKNYCKSDDWLDCMIEITHQISTDPPSDSVLICTHLFKFYGLYLSFLILRKVYRVIWGQAFDWRSWNTYVRESLLYMGNIKIMWVSEGNILLDRKLPPM